MLRLASRADPRAVGLIAVLTVAYALSIGAIALSQRWIVAACRDRIAVGVVAAVAAGVAGHVIRAACHRIQTHLQGDLSDRVAVLVAEEVLHATAGIPTVTHLEEPEYLNRVEILQQGTKQLSQSCWTIADAAASALSLLLSVVLLGSISPVLTGLAFLALPPLWCGRRGQRIVSTALERISQTIRHEQQLHSLCVTPGSAKEIWIAGSGSFLSELADEHWEKCRKVEHTARMKAALWQAAGWTCYAAGLAGALAIVAQLVQNGQADLGDVVMIITLSVRLRLQVSDTVGGAGEIMEARRVAAEYLWIREYAASQPRGNKPAPTHIGEGLVLKDVCFSYPGSGREVLRNIDVSVPAGSTVGIVGLNGAGKTTLIKLLLGMYHPTRGEITVDGQQVSRMDPEQWYNTNAAAFQDFSKFHLTAGEVVGVGDLARAGDERAVREALDEAGAADVIVVLPEGLSTPLGSSHGGVELSHGQWQKLALARSLMRGEPLLAVLDEPTSALDPHAEQELFERITRRATKTSGRRGGVTILISHRFSALSMVDRIIVLKDGKVVEHGTHNELMAAGREYAALYKVQASAYA
ncbi:ABC transporter ATP-binding protein [Streptomyces xylophagus]|uniref:ABC transporter ATP-binding protein n=1 Tax=Streptomyces xylophagus TaxID=285514 RepID=UPI00068C7B2F|nr:ABC transporter ATP-binding protein [Streptomyces xylophagus]